MLTPGKNQKRYLAGALDVRTGLIHWVEGEQKTSTLFLALFDKLLAVYAAAKRIHVILNNYRIHSSNIVNVALAGSQRASACTSYHRTVLITIRSSAFGRTCMPR